jgi:hypothetical protein
MEKSVGQAPPYVLLLDKRPAWAKAHPTGCVRYSTWMIFRFLSALRPVSFGALRRQGLVVRQRRIEWASRSIFLFEEAVAKGVR